MDICHSSLIFFNKYTRWCLLNNLDAFSLRLMVFRAFQEHFRRILVQFCKQFWNILVAFWEHFGSIWEHYGSVMIRLKKTFWWVGGNPILRTAHRSQKFDVIFLKFFLFMFFYWVDAVFQKIITKERKLVIQSVCRG